MNVKIQWIAFCTIVRKEVVRFMRIWGQTLLPPVINQSLYFVIFGAFIGAQIGEVQGVSYAAFIVPGLVMMGVINNSFVNTVSSFFGSKFMHNVEELLVSPTSNFVIVMGYTVGGMLRGLLVGLLTFFVSFIFVQPQVEHPLIILTFVLLTALLFSLAGLLNAIFASKFDDISVFTTFILTPLTYLGGIFYPISSLPGFWQTVSKFNPIVYMVDGFRYGFFGFSDVNVWVSLGALGGFVLLFFAIDYYLLERGIRMKS